ncbi:hypothetical protein H0H81_004959 [Sphagnurus paluster]|uniref:DUF6699 domain-containing protein n=1 Tax=Sphagnurus paluster TaxID=117069 RepID=A0A9P7GLV2_9AGAR|nr:hypothetical protein H0H81_004959 [Sphagnurus paluster]
MPGKHVRFEDVPSTPSLTYTPSNLSSTGPITPPPLSYHGSPYASKPLPALASRIHPLLSGSDAQTLRHDISLPLDLSRIPDHILNEPATEPPLPYMIITCAHLPREWEFRVLSTRTKQGTFVTVGGVISALYANLRFGVEFANQGAYEAMVPSDHDRRMINAAWKRRYTRIWDAKSQEEERKKGLKRIDFLKDRNTFAGLAATRHGPEIWELVVS